MFGVVVIYVVFGIVYGGFGNFDLRYGNVMYVFILLKGNFLGLIWNNYVCVVFVLNGVVLVNYDKKKKCVELVVFSNYVYDYRGI